MTPVDQLKARFPYMFRGEAISIELCDGWFPIFAEACRQIDEVLGENKRGFCWIQLKEKFGSARFYYRLGNSKRIVVDLVDSQRGHTLIKDPTKDGDPTSDRIDAIVDQAEARTQTNCMICGAPAQTWPYGGYYMTLCPSHAPRKRVKPSGET